MVCGALYGWGFNCAEQNFNGMVFLFSVELLQIFRDESKSKNTVLTYFKRR